MNFYTVKIVILNFGASQFLPSLNIFLCTYPQPQLKKKFHVELELKKMLALNSLSLLCLSVVLYLQFPLLPLMLVFHLPPSQRRSGFL